MVLCLAVTIGFRDTKHLGNASGKFINYPSSTSTLHIACLLMSATSIDVLEKWEEILQALVIHCLSIPICASLASFDNGICYLRKD